MRNKLIVMEKGNVCELQPDTPITQVAKMVEWCEACLEDEGIYSLVREVPGVLVVERQSKLVCKFKQEKK